MEQVEKHRTDEVREQMIRRIGELLKAASIRELEITLAFVRSLIRE